MCQWQSHSSSKNQSNQPVGQVESETGMSAPQNHPIKKTAQNLRNRKNKYIGSYHFEGF